LIHISLNYFYHKVGWWRWWCSRWSYCINQTQAKHSN